MSTIINTPLPLGIAVYPEGINFSFCSSTAKRVELCLSLLNGEEIYRYTFDNKQDRTGNIWHTFIKGLHPPLLYSYIIDDSPPLLDPYARCIATGTKWGQYDKPYAPVGCIPLINPFDWQGVKSPNHRLEDLIIYEMHVRAFTQHRSSQVKAPGTFLGIIEKIPHLKKLGINALELLPLHEFNECEYSKSNPLTSQRLCNFWGYSTVNFFSPMNRYAHDAKAGSVLNEFKLMVRELHREGIEVILDVVYNHTAEGNHNGPTLSFRGMDAPAYYIFDSDGAYANYSGCGNTFSCNNLVSQTLIIDSLRYWVIEMGVDGFRFDLASILTRDANGVPMDKAPLIEAITNDPVLASTKLIAEPWDAAGLYEVSHFANNNGRWSEWNGAYRDSARRFIKGTPGVRGDFATRLCGSQDFYHANNPQKSINFVTAHDGFTLADLVSFNHKHNIENGENNQDGSEFNDSWNCGVEGISSNSKILAIRERQMKNFHLALMVSQGIPMLLMGDEYKHTKKGNNNTWCQDNELNWFLWDQLEANKGFFRYYKELIHFRQSHPQLKRTDFLNENNVSWHGLQQDQPHWERQEAFLAFTLWGDDNNSHLFIAFNATDQQLKVELPKKQEDRSWRWVVNTAKPSPLDFLDETNRAEAVDDFYVMAAHSSILLETF